MSHKLGRKKEKSSIDKEIASVLMDQQRKKDALWIFFFFQTLMLEGEINYSEAVDAF